ncbi:MAG: WecB/TagA/CpsF family glycosyltransferase [Candidatus Thiodiazotropha sp. (ex Dulcina madagascariensis)]|nr:WecB/TagA/CpsF family glycosyltransferase [Candidatus Thiodiazotropha sp. (ex Dulcina madagascariensis)]
MKNRLHTHDSAPVLEMSNTMAVQPDDRNFLTHDEAWIQRFLDLTITLILLILALPVIAMRIGANLLKNSAPVTGRQMLGRFGAPFLLLSTRSDNGHDPITELFNVLRGDMSLVGPRPLNSSEAMQVPHHHRSRFLVRPGVFSAYRLKRSTGIDFESEWHTDCEEIRQSTLKRRLGIIARSLLTGILGATTDVPEQDHINLFGLAITNTTMDEALDWILNRVRADQPTNVGIVNADTLNKAYKNDDYHATLETFDRILADGVGVRMAGKIANTPLRGNLNGTDLFPRLGDRMAAEGESIFLFGARPGVAQAAADNIRQRYPGLKIAGTHHGYFSDEKEKNEIIKLINHSGAAVLLVALGAPGQEQWISDNANRLKPPVRIGVGGLFDFYSGRIPRAPLWVREVGMEWIWRLIQEPRRMWRRYVIGNPLFLFRVWLEHNRIRTGRNEHHGEQDRILAHSQKLYRYPQLLALRARLKRWIWFAGIHAQQVIKRVFDVACVSLMLILLAPFLLLVGLAIKLDSAGPVLFSQLRAGKSGKPFRLWKFRSMHQDSERKLKKLQSMNDVPDGVLFKMKNDPRITWVGRFIRKYSIDELPQLWNVLKGEMSLVGPRPALPSEVSQYSLQDLKRLETVPGLTCYWQVSGRSLLGFQQQVALDTEYLYAKCFTEDLKILLRTVPAVLRGEGAY